MGTAWLLFDHEQSNSALAERLPTPSHCVDQSLPYCVDIRYDGTYLHCFHSHDTDTFVGARRYLPAHDRHRRLSRPRHGSHHVCSFHARAITYVHYYTSTAKVFIARTRERTSSPRVLQTPPSAACLLRSTLWSERLPCSAV